MAEIIPDRIPTSASAGEKRLFSILQNLPDDYLVYYEPVIENRYPDFVVIAPDLGLMIIEVKGWHPKHIVGGDHNKIWVNYKGSQESQAHPVGQARNYMYKLMDLCKEDPKASLLLQHKGPNKGKLFFPLGHFAVLSNITSDQMKNHQIGDLYKILPSNKVVARDELLEWESYDQKQLKEALSAYFDPKWSFPIMKERQIDLLRQLIHPEIKLDQSQLTSGAQDALFEEELVEIDIEVLDRKQENNARNIGSGHRILYGVAGSGKTVLLICRAKLLGQQRNSRILVLCYNVSLASYLSSVLADFDNIEVLHFDAWAIKNGVTRQPKEDNDSLGQRLLSLLEEGYGDTGQYRSILVDEAQDFNPTWFRCVLEAMEDPLDGDLLIVGDASQGLYPKGRLSWKEIGIQAQGRVAYKKFDLDKNYRNSKEIVSLASVFSSPDYEDDDDIGAIPVKPDEAIRETGFKPVLAKSESRIKEAETALTIVKGLLRGNWFGESIEPLHPSQIGILYPLLRKKNKNNFNWLHGEINKLCPCVWLSDPGDKDSRKRVMDEGVKLLTIHASKGLQYKAVIILWADELPRQFEDTDFEIEKKLLYVGLTRAEDYLAINFSGHSLFIAAIEKSKLTEII